MNSVHRSSSMSPHHLRQKALDLLEFPKVLHRLAQHTTFPLARDLALTLTPAYDPESVALRQREREEAHLLLEAHGDVDLSQGPDIRRLLRRAELGGMLTGPELMEVRLALECLRQAKSAVQGRKRQAPTLVTLVRDIPDVQPLHKELRAKIGPAGQVVDTATPYLGLVRQQARNAYQRLREALEGIMSSPLGQEVLQDKFVTIRSERMVLPVRAEFRHRLPGIVHAVSDSGATLFIEPLSAIDMGNTWRELTLEEEREVEIVLRDLSAQVGRRSRELHTGLEQAARLDLALAKARLARQEQGVAVQRGGGDHPVVKPLNARHPLLIGDVVPITLEVGPDWSVLLITGPNTGGKTVALKTVGLLALMHQAGLAVPASEGTRLAVFDGVYADIGDEQSIERSVSSFSSHVSNIADILEAATSSSLVLLDELGTSTDPEEGSALAKAILAHLAHRRVSAVVTTHHRSLAAFVEEQRGMRNASVELDPVTLRPTYRVTMGLPGRSYALAVAERLGLPAEVLGHARDLLDPAHVQTETLLAELQRERLLTGERLRQTEESKARADALQRELEQRLEDLAVQRDRVLEETRHELQARAREVLRALQRAEAAAAWSAAPTTAPQAREQVAQVQRQLKGAAWRPSPTSRQAALRAGDLVEIGGLGFAGKVLTAPDSQGKVEVLVGDARVSLDIARLRKTGESPPEPPSRVMVHLEPSNLLVGPEPELHLRGLRAQEALERLDAFLDQALAQGRSRVRIVHGKGTGVLRQAVWKHLGHHPAARAYALAEREQGGEGVTVVEVG